MWKEAKSLDFLHMSSNSCANHCTAQHGSLSVFILANGGHWHTSGPIKRRRRQARCLVGQEDSLGGAQGKVHSAAGQLNMEGGPVRACPDVHSAGWLGRTFTVNYILCQYILYAMMETELHATIGHTNSLLH